GAAGGDELLNDVITGAEGAWTSEPVLNVMKNVEKMQQEGYIDEGFGAINHTQSQMNFLLHDNAYIPVGFWLPNEMEGDKPEDLEYGFIPSPMNEAGEPMAVVPDLRPLAIAEQAENPEAAKAFVEFVFTKEYATLFSDRKSTRLNSSHVSISYAVFCLKKIIMKWILLQKSFIIKSAYIFFRYTLYIFSNLISFIYIF